MIWLAIACFAAMAVLDYALVRHQQAVIDRSPARAGAWSVACYLVGLVPTLAAVEVSLWMVIPSALGLLAGNGLALRA